jgi:Protein of unknown function (DUF2971)
MKEQAKPDLLYHYTDQNGLIGIVESQAFRATDIRFLNDTEEFDDGLRTAISMAKRASADTGEGGQKVVKYLKDNLSFSFSKQPVFSVSLTGPLKQYEILADSIDDPGDRLNMWRSYSGSGNGYSIGIPKEVNEYKIINIEIEGVYRQECSYRQDTKEEYLTEVLNRFVVLVNKCNSNAIKKTKVGTPYDQAMDEMRSELNTGFDEILPDLKVQIAACKHEGFWEEREWRLTVAIPSKDARLFHTSGRFGITPRVYFKLSAPDGLLPIKRIVVGPCPHKTEALESLRGLLVQHGYSHVELSSSQIPYRNW